MKKPLVKMLHIVQVLVLLAAIVAVPASLGTKKVEAAEETMANYAPSAPSSVYSPGWGYNSYTGIGVNMSAGATTSLKSSYKPANPEVDPWAGGVYSLGWTGQVDATILGGGSALTTGNGFGFVAHVNLPDEVEANSVINAIDYSTAKLGISKGGTSQTFTLGPNNFEAIGPHTLRLTLRSWNSSGNDLLSGMIKFVMGLFAGLQSANNINVSFNVNVDVSKMMAAGLPSDTSPNKVLTKGKFPPNKDRSLAVSVDFYGKDQIIEEYQNNWSIFPYQNTSTKLFAKPNIPVGNLYRATTTLPTWDKYISPSDSKGVYNTNNDPTETVNGSSANLPGTVGARTLTPNRAVETFDEIMAADPNRFNRVLNFFTKQPVTEGVSLSASPLTAPTISNIVITPESNPLPDQKTVVNFTGKVGNDLSGLLSPVSMTVVDKWDHPTVDVSNIPGYVFVYGTGIRGTIISINDQFVAEFGWQSPYLRTGNLHFRLLRANPGEGEYVPVAGYTDVKIPIKAGTDPTKVQKVQYQLGKLPAGIYVIDFKVIDDYRPNDPYDNKWLTDKHVSSPETPALAVMDGPSLVGSSTVTNISNHQTGTDINVVDGDTVEHDGTFKVTYIGKDGLSDRKLTVSLPASNASYVKGSLKASIKSGGTASPLKVDDTTLATTGTTTIAIADGQQLKLNDEIQVTYQLKINGVANTVVNLKPIVFNANVTTTGEIVPITGPINPVYTTANTVTIPAQEFKLLKVPSDLGFGTLAKPAFTQDVPLASGDFSFGVRNTYSDSNHDQWQITATLAQGFQSTTDNQPLAGSSLIFKSGNATQELSPTSATNIYTGNQKGDIPVTFSGKDGLYLHLEPNPNVEMNTEYSSTITWALTNGPGS